MALVDYIGDILLDVLGDSIGAAEVVPLPNDASIFGAYAVQVYLIRDPYLTYLAGDVTLCENAANPGVSDMVANNPPLFVAGGLDGKDCVDADSSANESLQITGMPFLATDHLQLQAVVQSDNVAAVQFIAVLDQGGGGADDIVRVGNQDATQWFFYAVSTGGGAQTNITSKVGTGPRLLGLDITSKVSSYQNGVENAYGSATAGGINTNVSAARILSQRGFSYFDGRLAEMVFVRNFPGGVSGQDAARVAYQDNRIAIEYPTIGAAL